MFLHSYLWNYNGRPFAWLSFSCSLRYPGATQLIGIFKNSNESDSLTCCPKYFMFFYQWLVSKAGRKHVQSRISCAGDWLMVKKCLDNNIFSNNFLGHFERLQHGKNTRNSNISVKIPKIKLKPTKKAFFYCGAIEFNKLPRDIRPYAVSRSNN